MINCFAIFSSFWQRATAALAFWPQDNSILSYVKCQAGTCARLKLCLFLIALGLLGPGCVHQQTAQSAELATFHQGNLRLPDNPKAPKLIYVDCGQSGDIAPHLNRHLEKALTQGKFRLAKSPSQAGYILHVNVLKHGNVAPEELKAAVSAGYGSKTIFRGKGANAVLVDALMVQRRVPEASRPNHQKMKNISSRNAIDSSQMRMGIMAHGSKHGNEEFSRAIAEELALRVKK